MDVGFVLEWRALRSRIFNEMSDIYLGDPPAGEDRSLTEPPTRHSEILAVGIATTCIAAVAVCLRFYTRLTIYAIAGTCVYALSVGFAKLSILLFYLRLSPQRWFRILVYTLTAAVSCYSIIYLFLNIFPRRPIAAAWDLNIEASTCVDAWNAYRGISILNILMDVATLVLPIPVVAPLNMPKKQKISGCLLFATDRTWDVAEDYILSYLETNVGIICASVPVLRPFFLRFLPALVTSSLSSSDGDTSKRQPRRSYGLTSVVEQNRQRRMMQQSSYELSSIDENLKQLSEDDETKLWSPGRKEGAVKVNTKSKDKDPEISSLEMLEDLAPARVRGVNEITVSSGPSRPVQGRAIQVHHGTTINYEGR
ncbi:hypothetical protein DL769_007047 [Monosporascus sp. CRB-8-3]|nr:hypothetical protein DL769_007047 [Monosporascus sp. CRB-8-3]